MTVITKEVDDDFILVEQDLLAPYDLSWGAAHLFRLHPELRQNAQVVVALFEKYGPSVLRLVDSDNTSIKAALLKNCSPQEQVVRVCYLIAESVRRMQLNLG